jgi:hypothetical protein
MKFDPANGEPKPYPSNADHWRSWHGHRAWLFNPWTGKQRDPDDIGSDVHGHLIIPSGEPIYLASAPKEGLAFTADDGTTYEVVNMSIRSTDMFCDSLALVMKHPDGTRFRWAFHNDEGNGVESLRRQHLSTEGTS